MIVNTNLTIWDLLQANIPVANRQPFVMARRCKELRNIHQIKSTIHCIGTNLTNIRVLWDHIWLNWYRFLTSVVREMWSDRGDSVFYSLIGRSILMNWAFAQQLGVLIPQRALAGSEGTSSSHTGHEWQPSLTLSCFTNISLRHKSNGNGNTDQGWPFNLLLVFKI